MNLTTRTLAVAATAAATLMFTGCAIPVAAPAPAVTVTETAAAQSPQKAQPTQKAQPSTPAPLPSKTNGDDDEWFGVFLEIADLGYLNSPEARDAAKGTCDVLDSGLAIEDVGAVAIASGLSADEAVGFIAASIAAYCPRHASDGGA